MANDFEVSLEEALMADDTEAINLKLSSPAIEVNVLLGHEEARALAEVVALATDAPAMPLGTSANADVHWGRDADGIYLLIGDDDEMWDVGVTLTDRTFAAILAEVASYLRER